MISCLLRIHRKTESDISIFVDFSSSAKLQDCINYVSKYPDVEYCEIIPHSGCFKTYNQYLQEQFLDESYDEISQRDYDIHYCETSPSYYCENLDCEKGLECPYNDRQRK